MTVLVDTTVWSLALRRRSEDLSDKEQGVVQEWASLVRQGQAVLTGLIRQEVLSGIRHERQFHRIRRQLSAFGYLPIILRDHDRAAEFYNSCRRRGVAATSIDMLLCAVAERCHVSI